MSRRRVLDDERSPSPWARNLSKLATRYLWLAAGLTVGVMGWVLRWMADDGFIYLRVADNLTSGFGPVFNPGLRVEAATSPLWLGLLALGRLITGAELEWLAMIGSLVLSVFGVAVAGRAAAELGGRRPAALIGVLAFSLMPFTWHFATSGLETGLMYAWIGASAFALISTQRSSGSRRSAATLGLIVGLGPLVRPEFALLSVVLGVGAIVILRRQQASHGVKWFLLAGLPIPVGYQLFRMVYFRSVVPITAIAKEAGVANWPQGLRYLADAVLDPLVAVVIIAGIAGLSRAASVAERTLGIAGVLLALAVVRGGGDFMRIRLLLPSVLLLAIVSGPAFIRMRRFGLEFLALALPMSLIGSTTFLSALDDFSIYNQRMISTELSGNVNPVRIADFVATREQQLGAKARRLAESGGSGVFELNIDASVTTYEAASPPAPVTVITGPIGILGFAAGPGVYIVDRFSLTDPIGARLELIERGPPGHEKPLPRAWIDARAGIDSPEARLVHQAEACGRVAALLRGIEEPLTLDLAWANLLNAVGDTFRTLSSEPYQANLQACSGGGFSPSSGLLPGVTPYVRL